MRSIKKTGIYGNKGFTLVELLIVVAIIGVLASQGVPAYTRMLQKSRKGEAQVMLGNIATSESGFFSEYGVYTNNIARAGAQLEGTNFVYAAGFATAACLAQTQVEPTQGVGTGQVPNLPGNWSLGVPGPVAPNLLVTTVIGKVINNVPAGTDRTLCQLNQFNNRTPGLGTNNGTYVAAATGNIVQTTGANARQCSTSTGVLGAVGDCDAWYIDQNRSLVNVVDGVK